MTDRALQEPLSALYALAQDSKFVFGSPLGPFSIGGVQAYVPRFVFFGPYASEDSWRLAFLAGLDHRDHRPSRALLSLMIALATDAERAHGLSLTFFPLLDVAGLHLGTGDRDLGSAWGQDAEPEIELITKDSANQAYHGFIRIETAYGGEEFLRILVRGWGATALESDLRWIASEGAHPFPVRFEVFPPELSVLDGPLGWPRNSSLAPFELILRVPDSWSDEDYEHSVGLVVEHFVRRYRAYQAYGQHL